MTERISVFIESCRVKRFVRIALLTYGAVSAAVIISLLVDTPHMDEWEWLTQRFMGAGWSNSWFWGFANEHREIPTWILAMLNLELFGLDFRLQMIVNLAIYYGMVWTIWRKVGAPTNSAAGLLLIVPFFSSLNYENHTMSEQNCIHICLWAFFGGTYLLYYHQKGKMFLVGLALLVLSIFSCASGIPAIISSYLLFLLWILIYGTKKDRGTAALGAIVIAIAISVWFVGYVAPSHHPKIAYPWHLRFYRGLAEIVSLGFGYERFQHFNNIFSYLCFGIVLIVCMSGIRLLFRSSSKEQSRQSAFLLSLTFGILAILSSIVMGRLGFGDVALKASRYFEYAVFLPLLCFALLFQAQPKHRLLTLVLLALVIGGSFDDFGIRRYLNVRSSRLRAKECIVGLLKFPKNNPSGICRDTYPGRITDRVLLAERLGVKFTRAKN